MQLPKTYAQIFTGLSHPRRIKLFNALIEINAPVNFGKLQEKVGLNAQAMTHHLRQMETAGLIKRHPKGCETLISLHVTELLSSFEIMRFQCQAGRGLAA